MYPYLLMLLSKCTRLMLLTSTFKKKSSQGSMPRTPLEEVRSPPHLNHVHMDRKLNKCPHILCPYLSVVVVMPHRARACTSHGEISGSRGCFFFAQHERKVKWMGWDFSFFKQRSIICTALGGCWNNGMALERKKVPHPWYKVMIAA